MSFRPDLPYNDLPPLPPSEDVETREVLRACISARAALAGLKQAAHLVPNASMLINTLPVLEAQASSAIENIVTPYDLQATLLHLLGIDHERLTFRFGGRDFRLTDVHGNVPREILA